MTFRYALTRRRAFRMGSPGRHLPRGPQVMVVHAGAELSPERLVSPAELAAVRAGRRA